MNGYPGSDEPAYDSFVSASLSYVPVNNELLVCVVVNEAFVAIRSPEYRSLLQSQIDLFRWDFGYGFASAAEKEPGFYILGLDNGKLSAEEYKSLSAWYAAPVEVRTSLLRDVYPYNILNENQLSAQFSDGTTLRQFIQRQPGGTLTRLTDYGLHLWEVSDAEVAPARNTLVGSALLISR